MNQVLTLVVRLQPTPEQCAKLKDTVLEFASCCEFINSSVKPTLTNRNSIQAVIYNDAKDKFNLVSNHVIRACARVGANRLTAKHKGAERAGGDLQPASGTEFEISLPELELLYNARLPKA
ncbi:MAG: hypothetical protein JOZ78_26640 [Chroococcidiopsidaceae cyanobacterium CP_BM_ER_R8_30]|nr:hypothetical protein [Chroococcidiopsidaceae cyanobacterium CP_BM_ER_R8_30]